MHLEEIIMKQCAMTFLVVLIFVGLAGAVNFRVEFGPVWDNIGTYMLNANSPSYIEIYAENTDGE